MKTVLQEIDESAGTAWLTLNRPEKKNALSSALMAELISILKEIADNRRIKCVVTTGAGDSYSSGLDLYDLRESWKRRRSWDRAGSTYEIVRLLRALPQVTVAAVRGWCLGGGLALVNGHDLAVAAESARFGMPEIIRGSYGAVATSSLFHSGVPFKKAFYIQLTGRNLTAAEAERVGLVSLVVPDDRLVSTVKELAGEIGTRDAVALESAKIAAYLEKDLDFATALNIDDLVSHRMRYYTNPLSDVEGYLQSQKGGGSTAYRKPPDRGK
ncbi:MAG TPA: enoyl-CoA hydratase/isomerase family protein [candidate division Zixibacteria bacterium]|nr:enoyl-CoA hydratase/isomerase family protein [candidate division Zixibacteria bacterium]